MMFIKSEYNGTILNAENVCVIYAASNGIVRTENGNGSTFKIGSYGTEDMAKVAIEMLFERMAASSLVSMPTAEEVSVKMRYQCSERERAANGKKTVRRGGS